MSSSAGRREHQELPAESRINSCSPDPLTMAVVLQFGQHNTTN